MRMLDEYLDAAADGPRWGLLTVSDKHDELELLVKHAMVMRGQAIGQMDTRDWITELMGFCNRRYNHLTVTEMRLAFDKGCRGEYGNKDTFVNMAVLERWLDLYDELPERRDALEEERRLRAEDGESEECRARAARRNRAFFATRPQELYAFVCEHGRIWYRREDGEDRRGLAADGMAAVIYDLLERRGKLSGLSDATRRDVEREMTRWYEEGMRRLAHEARADEVLGSAAEDHRKALLLERYMMALAAAGEYLVYEVDGYTD